MLFFEMKCVMRDVKLLAGWLCDLTECFSVFAYIAWKLYIRRIFLIYSYLQQNVYNTYRPSDKYPSQTGI